MGLNFGVLVITCFMFSRTFHYNSINGVNGGHFSIPECRSGWNCFTPFSILHFVSLCFRFVLLVGLLVCCSWSIWCTRDCWIGLGLRLVGLVLFTRHGCDNILLRLPLAPEPSKDVSVFGWLGGLQQCAALAIDLAGISVVISSDLRFTSLVTVLLDVAYFAVNLMGRPLRVLTLGWCWLLYSV